MKIKSLYKDQSIIQFLLYTVKLEINIFISEIKIKDQYKDQSII